MPPLDELCGPVLHQIPSNCQYEVPREKCTHCTGHTGSETPGRFTAFHGFIAAIGVCFTLLVIFHVLACMGASPLIGTTRILPSSRASVHPWKRIRTHLVSGNGFVARYPSLDSVRFAQIPLPPVRAVPWKWKRTPSPQPTTIASRVSKSRNGTQ